MFTELLKPTASDSAPALIWDAPARLLTLTGKRAHGKYRVTELDTDGGRGFQLAKVSGGSDAEADGYACFLSAKGPGWDTCECRGWLRWGHCRHLSGLRELLKANQL